MAIQDTGIGFRSVVGTVLGTTATNEGVLCTHPNVNMWSKWKPIAFPKVSWLTNADIESVGSGLIEGDTTTGGLPIAYQKPVGGATQPFRIGDFRNYNHDALPPVSVNIISVDGQTVPPYRVRINYQASIVFKLIPGSIDPSTIPNRNNCVRVKNTNPSGGFGGISWIGETTASTAATVNRPVNEVFGTELLDVTFTQLVRVNNPPRLEYMEYLGDANGSYENTRKWIEDQEYLNKFDLINYTEEINFMPNPTLFYDQIVDRVTAFLNINNESGFVINTVRIRARYTINASSMPDPGVFEDIDIIGATFELPTGNNGASINLTYYQQGETQTYTAYFFLEERIGNDWVQLSSVQIFNKDIYIPIPA